MFDLGRIVLQMLLGVDVVERYESVVDVLQSGALDTL
jgi:hypothetical protein